MMNDDNATARLNAQIQMTVFYFVLFLHIVNLLSINEHGNRYLSRKKNRTVQFEFYRTIEIEKYNPNDDDNNCHLNSTHS